MKTYYIYSNYYGQDWIDYVERIQNVAVFRNENAIKESIEYATPQNEWHRFEIFKERESYKLINQDEEFNIVFAVQALE